MIDEANTLLSAVILLLAGGMWPVGFFFSCFSCCGSSTCAAETGPQPAAAFQTQAGLCFPGNAGVLEFNADAATTPGRVFSSIAFDRGATSPACGFSFETGLFFVTGGNQNGGNAEGPTASVSLSIDFLGDPSITKADPVSPKRAIHAHRFSCFEFVNPEFYSGTYSLPFSGGRAYSTYISGDDLFAVSLAILRCGNSPVVVMTVMVLPVQPGGSNAQPDYIGGNYCNSLGISLLQNPGETPADACLRLLAPFPRNSLPSTETTAGCCIRRPLFFGRYYFRSPGQFSYGDSCVGNRRSVVMPDYEPLGFSGETTLNPLNVAGGFFLTSFPTVQFSPSGQFNINSWALPECHCISGSANIGGDNSENRGTIPAARCGFSVSFANP